MHPDHLPVILAAAALVAAAVSAVLGRWRDLSALPLTWGAAAAVADPAQLPALLPTLALALVGVVRGASRGVARPEVAWLAMASAVGAGAAAREAAALRPGLAVALAAVGALLAGLAATRRTSVRVRPSFAGEIPVQGGERP